LGAQLPTLVALAAHAAICVTGVSLTGAAALWICRSRSAPLRHALALAFIASTLLVPAIAALYQYSLIRFHFASPPRQSAATAVAARPQVGPALAPLEELAMTGAGQHNGSPWSFIACAAFAILWAVGARSVVYECCW
jgi:hypothetical protein